MNEQRAHFRRLILHAMAQPHVFLAAPQGELTDEWLVAETGAPVRQAQQLRLMDSSPPDLWDHHLPVRCIHLPDPSLATRAGGWRHNSPVSPTWQQPRCKVV